MMAVAAFILLWIVAQAVMGIVDDWPKKRPANRR
jgi:hypothetical protein